MNELCTTSTSTTQKRAEFVMMDDRRWKACHTVAEDFDFDQFLQRFAADQLDPPLVAEWAERITATILDGLPDLAADPELTESIRRTAANQWVAFLDHLNDPELVFTMVPSAVQMAIDLARSERSLAELFRLYGLARRGVWEYVKEVLVERIGQGGDTELLIFFWDRAGYWIDEVVEASAVVFENERDRLREGAAAQLLGTISDVVAGDWTGDERALSEALGGHPVSGHNTALILSASPDDDARDLNALALDLARSAGVRNPLIVSPGGRDLWVWLGTVKPPEISQLVAAEQVPIKAGVRVAVGSPGVGIDGIRHSHLEARKAQEVAAAARHLANPLYFPDVETLVMLWQSGDQAVRFVRRTLGDLYDNTEPMSRLRQTARATLRAGSIEKAADALTVHKNTIRYRLGQIETALGRGLNDNPVPLALALDYHEAFLEDDDLTR